MSSSRPFVTALLGVKHSGKSTVAGQLSKSTGVPWVDLDTEILKKSRYDSVRSLYRACGPEAFRVLEARTIRDLAIPAAGLILSTGGGIADNPEALDSVSKRFFCIHLAEREHVLYDRIIRDGIPPFLSEEQPKRDFEVLFHRRDRIYRQTADMIIDCNQQTITLIVEKIRNELVRFHEAYEAGDN
ncbi:MAG: shikimate kinase [Spirochaetota bacterium]